MISSLQQLRKELIMEIDITASKREPLSRRLHDQMRQKVYRAFERLGHLVRRVEFRVEDVNGPKGGICKRCLGILRLKDGRTIAVEQRHEAAGGAMASCIDLARQQVAKVKERREEYRTHRRLSQPMTA